MLMKIFAGLAGGAAVSCTHANHILHTHLHRVCSGCPPLYLCTIFLASMTYAVSIDTPIYIGIHQGDFASSRYIFDLFKYPMSEFFHSMSFIRHSFHYFNSFIAQSLTLTMLLSTHIWLGRNLKGIHAPENTHSQLYFFKYYPYSPLSPHMSRYSYLFVFNLQIYFYHLSTLFIWHKCLFQPFITPYIPIAPVSLFRPIISLTYNILYYFDSHLTLTPLSASYAVPKFLPTRYPLLSTFSE
jgi:hypothetical protein